MPELTRSLLLVVIFLTSCSEAQQQIAQADLKPVVLKAEDAKKEGSIQYKWGRWNVWCGHNICSGIYSWTFPNAGEYSLVWKEVVHKCAGSPPYSLYIDGKKIRDGKIKQHGSCNACTGQNIVNNPDEKFLTFKDIKLGRYQFKKDSLVQLWVQNAFDCGIQNPGAYGDFLEVHANP